MFVPVIVVSISRPHPALVLLSSLLTLVGCSRREILDDYPVTGINIRLDWEGVTGRLPEGTMKKHIKCIFLYIDLKTVHTKKTHEKVHESFDV